MPEFVHLHVHSDYSLLDGACRLDRLFRRVGELGMKAVAITDHGNLFAIADAFLEAKNPKSNPTGVKPIVGCELYLVIDHKMTEKPDRARHTYYHLGILARNAQGYDNLQRLVSKAHREGMYYKPRVDWETLAAHAGGLLAFTGCLQGVVPQMLLKEGYDKAREWTAKFIEVFGRENYVVELQNHNIKEQTRIEKDLVRLAREFGLKIVCTNDVHYVNRSDAQPHDILLCIQTGAKVADEKRMRFDGEEFYLKSPDEMARLYAELPEALSNTLAVAEMCDVKLAFGKNRYPVFRAEESVKVQFANNADYLKHLCVEGLRRRYGVAYADALLPGADERAKGLAARLDYELGIIAKTGFLDYFLIVQDFIGWARRQGIPVGPGRGSGAGCLVAYVLGITDIDPLRFGLLFERFLNPERVSPPDFDIDFCMRRREEVVAYVRQKYGEDCVANIITFGTLGAKAVVRDVARVLDLPFAEGDRLAKMIPEGPDVTLDKALEMAELKAEVERNPQSRKIIETGKVLEGMVRNTGTHAAGIIIADRPLVEFIPLTLQDGVLTTQFPKDPVEKLGLLKMDFLGLKTLTVIDDAEVYIRQTTPHKRFRVDEVPLDDPKTYQLLAEARTVGVFQMESGGMQNLCRQLNVSTIDEIVALIALYRPGPMDLIPDYIRGKRDPASVRYPHPLLEGICRETYGIMVYQEQVMEATRIIAGYTLGGADMLRRAMGKKQPEEMEKQRPVFVQAAAAANGIDAAKATEIFALLEKFAGYGFNKSHSAAYAILTYRTAYLKANFPAQFMAAVLASELGNAEKVAHFIDECAAMGLPVLGPDINRSRQNFFPVTDPKTGEVSIRFGLGAIKGVGDQAAARIIEEREKNGDFAGFDDFLDRVDGRAINKRVLEHLIKTGAFDSVGADRGDLLGNLDALMGAQQARQRDKERGQANLFDMFGGGDAGPAVGRPPPAPPLPLADKLQYEKDLLGFYVSGHPLQQYRGLVEELDTFAGDAWKELGDRALFRVAGVVATVAKKISKKDNRPWAIVGLSTREGACAVNLYAETWEQVAAAVNPGALVVITGQASHRNGEVTLQGDTVTALDAVLPKAVRRVTFLVRNDPSGAAFAGALRDTLLRTAGATEIGVGWRASPAGDVAFADVAGSLTLHCTAEGFRALRKHPGCDGAIVDVAPPEAPAPRWKRNGQGGGRGGD